MQETQICTNCKKEILASKSGTHFSYCRRNIIKCSTCGEMFDKNFLEEHQQQFHLNKQCEYCSTKFKSKDFNAHISNCVMKPKCCEYCQLDVPSKQYNAHVKMCESRTTQCQLCQKSIVNKEQALHKAICKGKQALKNHENGLRTNAQKQIYKFEDSLSYFNNLNDFYDRGFKKQVKKAEPKQKQKFKKQNKKQQKPAKSAFSKNDKHHSQKKQQSPQKRSIKDPKQLSRQHFYNNYFQNSPQYFEYADEEMNSSDFNAFLPQHSIIMPNYGYGEPQGQINGDTGDISMEEQLLQQTLFESSKKQKSKFTLSNLAKDLPSDLLSNDIMNSSFYHDILDIQKQRAIQEDLETKNAKKQKVSKKK